MSATSWQQLNARYDALKLREKRLVFFGLLLVLAYLLLILLLEPAWLRYQQAQRQTVQLQQQLAALTTQNEQLAQELSVDINQPLRQQLAQQLELNQQQAEQLKPFQARFITGSQTVALLHDVLAEMKALQLVSLQAAAAKPMHLPGQDSAEPPALYQHLTTVVVQGKYDELQQLVQALERLPWLLSWQQLDYQVQQYPLAHLTLQLATVSEHESYIQF